MKNLFILFLIVLTACNSGKINRKEVVDRHSVTLRETNSIKPMQVGNGEFAFNVDITGLQTFVPHNTMAHWAWHNMPLPKGYQLSDFKRTPYKIYGRTVEFELDNPEQPKLSKWLAANPHPLNLGRIGLHLTHADGSEAGISDIQNPSQHLDLWSGIITSTFVFEGQEVVVKTACHPTLDEIGVEIDSDLISKGQLKILMEFPYADDGEFRDFIGDYKSIEKHNTKLQNKKGVMMVDRIVDDMHYQVAVKSNNNAITYEQDEQANPHKIIIPPSGDKAYYTFQFSKGSEEVKAFINDVFAESAEGWKNYWLSGAAVDFSNSKDERWYELERRVVLSQYHMKVNNAGSLPPQESGLLKNGWYGKFHFEMLWWHGVHFALWDRWNELDKMLGVYEKFLPSSLERAENQGYKGARWPKCTGNDGREWPFIIHAFLIWQQPHPIYFAELDYRLHPKKGTLEKWKDVVFATADFMASYPFYDSLKDNYNFYAPVYLVSENTNQDSTQNPAFELSYWKYGLRVAREWRTRLNMPSSPEWDSVYLKLAPLPIEDNKYITHEGIKDMWTRYNYEHPGLVATYGMLPGEGVDTAILRNTFHKLMETWNFDKTWGWDFPLLAMTAARLNEPETAIDLLLHESKHFEFDSLGYNSWVYFPGNGGLLSAVGMMAGGWDGAPNTYAPGFPKDGNWEVKVEGFNKMP